MIRDHRLLLAAALVVLGLGLAACGGNDQGTAPDGEAATDNGALQTFVAAPEGDELTDEIVVVTVEGDRLSAYVCDGAGAGEFFEGTVEGDRADLESARGATLEARVTEESVEGTYAISGRRPVDFTAEPNANAGTYLVTIGEDGSMRGESPGGGTLSGQFAPGGLEGSGTYPGGGEFSLDADVVGDHPPHIDDLVRAGAAIDAVSANKVFVVRQGTEQHLTPVADDSQQVAQKAAGEYRFNVVEGLIVGRGTGGGTKTNFVSECVD